MTRRKHCLPCLLPGVPQRVKLSFCEECRHWVPMPCVACRTTQAIEMGSVKPRQDFRPRPPELDLEPDEQTSYDEFWEREDRQPPVLVED